jgi:hypothetical protein
MNDKEWLDKVMLAYRNYPYVSVDIEKFIQWMYQQYGVVTPDKRDK